MTYPRLIRPKTPRALTGIVHLGLGAFARAFVCPFVADAMKASGGDWGIAGVSLRSPDTRGALAAQDWAYTAVTLSAQGHVPRVMTVLNDVLVAPEDPSVVLNAMADPNVKIVSLTVTEKGYCHHPATGALRRDHPDVIHDLAHAQPRSAIGFLVRAMQARKAAGARPFTVLCCDNLANNGAMVRGLVLEMASLIDPDLAAWIAEEGRFPSTMVDRITPATTPDDIERVAALTGAQDFAPVLHEPFAQWAIEDDFVDQARPDFAAAGAQMVGDVAPFEEMKLRMLNGSHSALAYSGYLAGHKTIAETVADDVFARFIRALWDEVIPTIAAPVGVDLHGYADALFSRYANPEIQHRTWQIAMDGSQKLPQRLLRTLRERLERGEQCDMLCFAVAAWMRYVGGHDDAGQPIDVRDPMADRLKQAIGAAATPRAQVDAVLAMGDIFPADLVAPLLEPVAHAYELICRFGARDGISKAMAG